jgi:uncharacterized RDD family membrane protein YckC
MWKYTEQQRPSFADEPGGKCIANTDSDTPLSPGYQGENIPMENQEYAGFWIRLAAALIDTVVLTILLYIPLMLIYGSDYWTSEEPLSGLWDAVLYIAPIVITVWFWKKYLGTPGKLVLRMRVVDANTGDAISTRKAIVRYVGYYLSAIPFLLGFIWIGFDKKKQGFHDKLAGTIVVRDIAK